MNKTFAAYDAAGEIQWTFKSLAVGDSFANDVGLQFVEVPENVSEQTHYIESGEAVEKSPLPIQVIRTEITADGVDECVISNIPSGVSVLWPDGHVDEVIDGEVRFSVDLPGEYILKFSAVPYLTQEVAIEAIPAT